eukprot:TRINITY_DN945_c0_g1_i2.p1 TRINITY_DN945_c0_g1~~TRINITY_DN945_c0_g1_i2.p1  ORF type:complete len:114 (-),score=19.01 TRINITY_DN945_c0_g1_i2:73-366(-)
MFDNNLETCWNSDSGSPQYVLVDFAKKVNLKEIKIMFQGGFVGKNCEVVGFNTNSTSEISEKSWVHLGYFYPENINTQQTFQMSINNPISKIKIIFG